MLIVLLLFFVLGLLRTVYFSFTKYDFFQPPKWVGLANYARLFSRPLFLDALRNTLFYAVGTTLIQTVFALALAVALNRKMSGRSFFRTAFYLPSVMSSVVVTLIFILIFRQTGTLNYLITQVARGSPLLALFLAVVVLAQAAQVWAERRRGLPAGAADPLLLLNSALIGLIALVLNAALGLIHPAAVPTVQLAWLTTTRSVLGPLHVPIPLIAIMLLNIWTTAPTFMIFFLAALQDAPPSLYEAAALDGATPWQQFRYVTMPFLRPVLFLVLTLGIIGTLALFDQVAVLGGLAPLKSTVTLAYYIYNTIFPSGATPEVGLASAASVFLALVTLVFVAVNRLSLREES
jgi:multiple sugar transport system permease protein